MNRAVYSMIKKEILEMKRSNLLRILLIAPVIQVIIFGFVVTTDIRNVKTIICNEDNTKLSRQLSDKFINSEYFSIVSYVRAPRKIDDIFKHNGAIIAVRIPKGFSKDIKKGNTARVQLIADGSDSNQSLISLNRASMIITRFSREVFERNIEIIKEKTGPVPSIGVRERIWYNPGLKSANTMVPGVIGIILLIVTLVVTAVSIVREKENGNIEQIMVTPIKPYQIVLGKTIPYAGLGFVNIIFTVLTGMIVFGIPFEGNFILLVFLSVFMVLAAIGTGVLISTVSGTQQQAMLSAMFIILPNILLSGFVFPIKNMPEILQYFTYFLPLRYYMEIIRGIFLKGTGLEALVPQTVMLFLFGAVLLTAAARMFRKTVV